MIPIVNISILFRKILPEKALVLLPILIVLSALHAGCSTIHPDVATAYYNRGQARFVLENDVRGAIEDFTRGIEFNPYDAYLYVGRGIAYLEIGNEKAAHKDFDVATSLKPELKEALKPLRSR